MIYICVGNYIMNIIKILYASLIGSLALIMMGSLCSANPRNEVKELSTQLQKIAQAAGKEDEQLGSYELRKKYKHFPKPKLIKAIIGFHYNEILKKYGHLSADEWSQAIEMIDEKIYRRVYDYHDVLVEGIEDNILGIDSWKEMVQEYPEMCYFFSILKEELGIIYQYKLDNLPFSSFLAFENGVFKIDDTDHIHDMCERLERSSL